MAAAASALLVLVMMMLEEQYFSPLTLVLVMVLGSWLRLTEGETLTDALLGGFILFFFAAAWFRFRNKAPNINETPKELDLRTLPPAVWMAGCVGTWLPLPFALLTLAVWWAIAWTLRVCLPRLSPSAFTMLGFAIGLFCVSFFHYSM
jgi:hypothetical protein